MICPNCGEKIPDNSLVCPVCSISVKKQPEPETPVQEEPQTAVAKGPALPMKWHKFLTLFALWAISVYYFFGGIRSMNGNQYGSAHSLKLIYTYYPELKPRDIAFGVCLILCGLLSYYAAYRLIGMKRNGPRTLLAFYIIKTCVWLSEILSSVLILSRPSEYITVTYNVTELIELVSFNFIMIFINYIYYRKRKHMFIY